MPSVTNAEVDKAFYDSYRDSAGNLDPRLVDPKTGNPRPLSMNKADAKFRKEWVKIRKHLQEVKGCAPKKGGSPVGAAAAACPPPAKVPDAPPYEPDKWNDKGEIQGSTNCYAYAVNSRTGHADIPQPGVKAGAAFTSLTCKDITSAVIADGEPAKATDPKSIKQAPQCPYQKQNQLPPPEEKGYYLVALVVTSNQTRVYDAKEKEIRESDYHWFRQDDNGMWSQKQGTTPVKNTDESGNLISNPQTCNRREVIGNAKIPGVGTVPVVLDYDVFCGYFYVKKGGADVQ